MDTSRAPLTPPEEAVWRALARLLVLLPRALDADLRDAARLSLAEYVVLMNLSEAPNRQIRMTDLANRVGLSLSRISRMLDGFAAQGLIVKDRVADDARGSLATLTDAGLARLRVAYPAHLASVRDRVVDHLGELDLAGLATALQRVERGL